MPKRLAAIALLLLSVPAVAEDFGSRFEKGYAQLRAGDPEAALASFNELLTETPDSELVRYSIAAAEYSKGVKSFEAGDKEAGTAGLNQARSTFESLMAAQTPFVREQAGFGAANSSAQLAKHYSAEEQYNERLQALQNAVAGYESVLESNPAHVAAATNLNHTRYLLKKMLQNPPENQQKSKDDEGNEGQQGEQEQPGEEGEQPEDSEKEEEESEDQNAPEDQKPGEPKDQKSTGKETEDENIQAILDSLEDKNREEQKNLRKAKGAPKILDGKWW